MTFDDAVAHHGWQPSDFTDELGEFGDEHDDEYDDKYDDEFDDQYDDENEDAE